MIYELVDHWQTKASVAQRCRLLGTSRSGYYAAKAKAKMTAICVTTVQLKAEFAASGRSYGSRRLVSALHAKNIVIGRYKVRRLMREAQIKTVWKRKFINTTDSKHDLPIANNILNRQFNPAEPNRAWTSDITYVRTRTGWLYLAVVMELFSRKIIGWAMDPSMPAELVCRALRMAVEARRIKGDQRGQARIIFSIRHHISNSPCPAFCAVAVLSCTDGLPRGLASRRCPVMASILA